MRERSVLWFGATTRKSHIVLGLIVLDGDGCQLALVEDANSAKDLQHIIINEIPHVSNVFHRGKGILCLLLQNVHSKALWVD